MGDAYFQGAPQEIIASQVGNQYLLSSDAQLALALARLLDGAPAPPPAGPAPAAPACASYRLRSPRVPARQFSGKNYRSNWLIL